MEERIQRLSARQKIKVRALRLDPCSVDESSEAAIEECAERRL